MVQEIFPLLPMLMGNRDVWELSFQPNSMRLREHKQVKFCL